MISMQMRADVAGFVGDALFAVEGLGQDAGRTGLADTPGAGEQEGVGHPAGVDGILQGAADMFLSGQLRKDWGRYFLARTSYDVPLDKGLNLAGHCVPPHGRLLAG